MRTRIHRGVVGVLIAALCLSIAAVAAVAATNKKQAKPPIRIALITLKLPGGGGNILDPMSAGVNGALKAIAAQGGWGGRKVIIDTCNSLISPPVATTCAHRTAAKKPVAMIGCEPVWGVTGLSVYARAKIPSLNCLTAGQDFTNPWSFGINASRYGQQRGMMRYLCTRPDVKTVVIFTYDIPSQHTEAPAAVDPILNGCGKKAEYVYYPLTAADFTPYIAQALQLKPDFVETSLQGTQAVTVFKGFQQSGFPASKMAAPDTAWDYNLTLKAAGSAMDGAYAEGQFLPWSLTGNPDIQAYIKAMKAAGVDYRVPNTQWGYEYIMWLYTAAKAIGFDKFNGVTLGAYMRKATGVHMPISRTFTNPGPKQYPQAKQPYVVISKWKNGKSTIVLTGKKGWFLGLG